MKIVAILDVDEDEFFNGSENFIKKFIEWDSYPTEEKEAVIITKNTMYGTIGLDTIDIDFGNNHHF